MSQNSFYPGMEYGRKKKSGDETSHSLPCSASGRHPSTGDSNES